MRIDLTMLFPFEEKSIDRKVFFEGGKLRGHRVAEAPEFELRVTHIKDRLFEFSGKGSITLIFPCDRCLTDVRIRIPFEIRRKANAALQKDEEEDDVYFFREEKLLDVDDLIEDEILLHLPARILCRDDCKGLCPVCGKDLNRFTCSCNKNQAPGRMEEALLKALGNLNIEGGVESEN